MNENRVAVVTGAARGIGRASAIALAEAGYRIAGADIAGPVSDVVEYEPATRADLDRTGELVADAGGEWMPVIFDQRDLSRVREGIAAVVERFGGVDVVFANAGIQAFASLLEMNDREWHDQIDVNLSGTANVLRVAAPLLVERGGGRIIITSSTQGQHGTLDGSAYSASKWGLLGLMKSAAMELGPHGITVNALIPGLIDTMMTRHEERYAQALLTAGSTPTGDEHDDEQTAAAKLAKKLPLRVPWIDPADVAPLVVFLASDAAKMVSGTALSVTGGDSANVTA